MTIKDLLDQIAHIVGEVKDAIENVLNHLEETDADISVKSERRRSLDYNCVRRGTPARRVLHKIYRCKRYFTGFL